MDPSPHNQGKAMPPLPRFLRTATPESASLRKRSMGSTVSRSLLGTECGRARVLSFSGMSVIPLRSQRRVAWASALTSVGVAFISTYLLPSCLQRRSPHFHSTRQVKIGAMLLFSSRSEKNLSIRCIKVLVYDRVKVYAGSAASQNMS